MCAKVMIQLLFFKGEVYERVYEAITSNSIYLRAEARV